VRQEVGLILNSVRCESQASGVTPATTINTITRVAPHQAGIMTRRHTIKLQCPDTAMFTCVSGGCNAGNGDGGGSQLPSCLNRTQRIE
jgi:hypothetical protein